MSRWGRLLLIIIAIAIAVSCQDRQVETLYASYKRIALTSKIENVQPMTGIVFWAPSARELRDVISLEYAYMHYNEIVREEGVYDWTVVENMLNDIASRSHQAILRFHYTYPGKPNTAPYYIKERDDYEVLWGQSGNRDTEFPDWRCPELRRFHLEFYQKFAARYDSDPRLAFVQTGFGLWAEYHIYDGPYIEGQTFPSKQFQGEFFRALDEYFEFTPWSISIDASPLKRYGPFTEAGNEDLMSKKFGLFDDSFMHQNHDRTNGLWWASMDSHKRSEIAPMGGEFSYYTVEDQANVLNTEGIHSRVFESEAARYRLTYMIGNDQRKYQTNERIRQAGMSCGYEFTVEDFRLKGNHSAILIKNTGVAPIYRKAYIAVNGVRGEQSLHTLCPDESVWIEVASGGSSPVLTIECDHLVAGQKIEFQAAIN